MPPIVTGESAATQDSAEVLTTRPRTFACYNPHKARVRQATAAQAVRGAAPQDRL